MIKETDIQYRILYDSLSRFSIFLNKADSLPQIQVCLQQNIKYLYNYSLCRFHFFQQGTYVTYTVSNGVYSVETGNQPFFCELEQHIFDSSLPYHQNTGSEQELFPLAAAKETWIWKFEYGANEGMLVMLFSGDNRCFTKEQIPVLKMVSEMLYTKTRMVMLLEEIQQKQQALTKSYQQLEESNHRITELIAMQEKIILRRTKALTNANTNLIELIQFNSHNIREPLTRIMGLLHLQTMVSQEEFFTDFALAGAVGI